MGKLQLVQSTTMPFLEIDWPEWGEVCYCYARYFIHLTIWRFLIASRRKLTQLARNFFRGTKFPMKNVTTLKDQSILCEDDEEWAAQSRLHVSYLK